MSLRWKELWGMLVPMGVKCFIWLGLRVKIAVRDMLQHLGIIQEEENVCPICGDGMEESRHLFVHYSRVYMMWSKLVQL